jgi:hypothetical protein
MIFGNTSATIPEELRTDWFIARPLSEIYAELDYEAYMTSWNVIGSHNAGRWQTEGYTLEENRRQIVAHEVEHTSRRSLAFILLSPDERRSLGCIYMNPLQELLDRIIVKGWGVSTGRPQEAMVTFWVREVEQESDLPDHVVREVEAWLQQEWEFAGYVWRVRNEERRSILAMEQAGLEWQFGVAIDRTGRYNFWG